MFSANVLLIINIFLLKEKVLIYNYALCPALFTIALLFISFAAVNQCKFQHYAINKGLYYLIFLLKKV